MECQNQPSDEVLQRQPPSRRLECEIREGWRSTPDRHLYKPVYTTELIFIQIINLIIPLYHLDQTQDASHHHHHHRPGKHNSRSPDLDRTASRRQHDCIQKLDTPRTLSTAIPQIRTSYTTQDRTCACADRGECSDAVCFAC